MVNAGFWFLVNITNFEFLCRKVNFIHVGIVQNFIFFIKSARRFRKTICTLASQNVACISKSCHIESSFPNAFRMTPKFDSLQDWGLRFVILLVPRALPPSIFQDTLKMYTTLIPGIWKEIMSSRSKDCHKSLLLHTFNDQWRMWDVWSISLILNSYVENCILSMQE